MYTKMINDRQVFSSCNVIQMPDGTWISNPSAKQISDAGWEEYVPPVYVPTEEDTIQMEIEQLKQELANTDYIAIKAFEGEDMSKYGDWKGRRHSIRERINELEKFIHPQEETNE